MKICAETTAEMKTLEKISKLCASCLNVTVFKCIITRVFVIKIVLKITKQNVCVRVCACVCVSVCVGVCVLGCVCVSYHRRDAPGVSPRSPSARPAVRV